MNVLLSKFSNNSEDLNTLLVNYQDYFKFEKNQDDSISLYLDIQHLKEYLTRGEDIKYRKFIFLFLENIHNQKNNKNYQWKISSPKKIHSLIGINITQKDIQCIQNVIQMIHFLANKNNSCKIKNKKVICLDNDLYIDFCHQCFLMKENLQDHKIHFRPKGFLINNQSITKNIYYTLTLLNYSKTINSSPLLKKTNCHLFIISKLKINIWTTILKQNYIDKKIITIESHDQLEQLHNQDIFICDFLIISSSLFFYQAKINEMKFSNQYFGKSHSFEKVKKGILLENTFDKSFSLNKIKSLYSFNWLNIVVDDIDRYKKQEGLYINNLDVVNYKYIISENEVDQMILQNIQLIEADLIDKYSWCNFSQFIENELTIRNNEQILISKDEVISRISEDEEEKILSKMFHDNEKELSLYYLKSINNFFYQDNKENIKDKILNETDQSKEHFVDDIIENYNNQYFCCICMERIEKENLCLLGCCHYFCKNCILMHKINDNVQNHTSKCPVCRYSYNLIFNIHEKNNKLSKIMTVLTDTLIKEKDQKIVVICKYNESIQFIYDELKESFPIQIYKKKNNASIQIIRSKYLMKNLIQGFSVFVYIQLIKSEHHDYISIKNIYQDIEMNKIKFHLIQIEN